MKATLYRFTVIGHNCLKIISNTLTAESQEDAMRRFKKRWGEETNITSCELETDWLEKVSLN